MALAGKHKFKRVVDFAFRNLARETITEVEVFLNTAKAFLDDPEKVKCLDDAFVGLRNRIFDVAGEETRRLQRYLDCWEVKQVSEELDWIEYNLPNRFEKKGGGRIQ
jgi:hypothetical protein